MEYVTRSAKADLTAGGTEGDPGARRQDHHPSPAIPRGETAETAESAWAAIKIDLPPAHATAAGPTVAATGTLDTATPPADAVPSHADPLGTSSNAACGGPGGQDAVGSPSPGSVSRISPGRLFAPRSVAGVVKFWSNPACHSPLVPLRRAKAADVVA